METHVLTGISTTTAKHVTKKEELGLEKQLEKPVDPLDLKYVINKTNAFILSESHYDPNVKCVDNKVIDKDNLLSPNKEDAGKTDEKKAKKGFFGTLKSIMTKSTDQSDSESEKLDKKEKRDKKKKKKDKDVPTDLPVSPPSRPPRKPKLPTPPLDRYKRKVS